jgi:hypothetical protein
MKVADPTIAEVFERFLDETDEPDREKPFTDRRAIVELLESCLDGYAYEFLSDEEQEFWRTRWETDEEANSFCRTFGPEKIPDQIDSFLGWFMIRKVLGPPELGEAAGPVVAELLEWLVDRGQLGRDPVAGALVRAREAGRDLPRADELGSLLHDLTNERISGDVVEDLDLCDETVTIARIEPGKLWFEHPDGIAVGPLRVPPLATKLAVVGWEVSATHFVRTRKRWYLTEVGNVYPR